MTMNSSTARVVWMLIGLLGSVPVYSQRSVFQVFTPDNKLASRYVERGDLAEAVEIYQRSKSADAVLMLARLHFRLRAYQRCIDEYNQYLATGGKLSNADEYTYAEACLTVKKYDQALVRFQHVLQSDPTNAEVLRKIWRISNLTYLFEDSIHFATRSLRINTNAGEWGSVPVGNALLFLSNRPSANPVKQLDAGTNQPFYSMFRSTELPDTLLEGWSRLYSKPIAYNRAPSVTGNVGSFCVYDKDSKMIFTASARDKNSKGVKTLGLYFAELRAGRWKVVSSFEHNHANWSITDPALDTVNQVLYFASDKPGGFGKMDIYKSQLINDRWAQPINLGELINTSGDEAFPSVHQGTLYFSSNGQPGLGGLDMFKVYIGGVQQDEPVNLGYPMNSSFDDFAITLTDVRGNHGFFSSNRKHGGFDDDIYEFDMDMQTYPFEITGIVKQMDHTWANDSSQTRILRHAKILLVDNVRNITVQETSSNELGNFSLRIPYFSKFAIHVVDATGYENIAVFEIPRQRRESTVHEIVVVKDIFQSLTK